MLRCEWDIITIATTVDTYGHLVPGGNKAAVDRLDGLANPAVHNLYATTGLNDVSTNAVSA
jgi:hypothetical protein